MPKTFAAAVFALALLAAACGSSSDDGDSASTTTAGGSPETTAESPDATAAPPATDPPATDPPATGDTVPPDTDDGEPALSPISVELAEWTVDAPTTIAAGTVDFEITNTGDFSHELAVARGDGYDTLPQLDNGAVDEDSLGNDLLGKSDVVDPGVDELAAFDLEPGNYVLFCNIQVGPRSHAAQGQTLAVTVVG